MSIWLVLETIGTNLAWAPFVIIAYFGGLILAFTLHEFSHALTASLLGDDTAARLNRLTLNPLAHLEPVGTLLILLFGFGWAKPVPFNPANLRFGPRLGTAIVALAGPAMNIALALLFVVPIRVRFGDIAFVNPFGVPTLGIAPELVLSYVFSVQIFLNVLLAVFNMLPIAPLDGFKVAVGLAPREMARQLIAVEQYGMLILAGIFALGWVFNFNVLGRVISPVISGTIGILVGA